jgi:hypothetical protein
MARNSLPAAVRFFRFVANTLAAVIPSAVSDLSYSAMGNGEIPRRFAPWNDNAKLFSNLLDEMSVDPAASRPGFLPLALDDLPAQRLLTQRH